MTPLKSLYFHPLRCQFLLLLDSPHDAELLGNSGLSKEREIQAIANSRSFNDFNNEYYVFMFFKFLLDNKSSLFQLIIVTPLGMNTLLDKHCILFQTNTVVNRQSGSFSLITCCTPIFGH